MLLAITLISAVILLMLSYAEPFRIKKRVSLAAVLLPGIASALLLATITSAYGKFTPVLLIAVLIVSIYFFIRKNDAVFGFFPVKNDFQALFVILGIYLLGTGIIIFTENFPQFLDHKHLILFIGFFALIFSWGALISLASQRAEHCNQNKLLSIVSVFGFIGTLVVYLFTKPKE
jgi:hypothetical protein